MAGYCVRKCACLLAAGAMLLASGCVSVPQEIKGSSATPQQDLIRVMHAPELYIGQEARFGGRVVNVFNNEGHTRLEIVTVDLDEAARPLLGEPSKGRIYAEVNTFLDPVDFRHELVTVVGPITGTAEGRVGNTDYRFMVMQVTGYKRWHVIQQVMLPPQPMDAWFYGGPYPYRGPYGMWGGWYNPGTVPVQSVVVE